MSNQPDDVFVLLEQAREELKEMRKRTAKVLGDLSKHAQKLRKRLGEKSLTPALPRKSAVRRLVEFVPVAAAGLSSQTMQAETPVEPINPPKPGNEISASEIKTPDQRTMKLRVPAESFAAREGTFNGVKINYETCRARDIGHIYESQMNPMITDGRKPIQQASYLGLYQFSLNGTIQNFVKEHGAEFPLLSKAMKEQGVRSSAFLSAWKFYSQGKNAESFENAQFDMMWKTTYSTVFDKLAEIPGLPKITKENCDQMQYKAFAGAVMSCANQNAPAAVSIMEQAAVAVRLRSKDKSAEHLNLAEVVSESYNIRSRRWKKLSSRYLGRGQDLGEKALAEGISACYEGQQKLQAQLLKQEKDRQMNVFLNADLPITRGSVPEENISAKISAKAKEIVSPRVVVEKQRRGR